MTADLFQREWKIAKTDLLCGACGRGIAPEDIGYATLHEEHETFIRRSFCAVCWDAVTDRGFSYWLFHPEPPPAKPFVADLAVLRDFYGKLAGKPSASDRLLRYLLALYLVRKKKFRLERTERTAEGETVWVRPEKEAPPEPVVVPVFAGEDIAAARKQLDALLGIDVAQTAP